VVKISWTRAGLISSLATPWPEGSLTTGDFFEARLAGVGLVSEARFLAGDFMVGDFLAGVFLAALGGMRGIVPRRIGIRELLESREGRIPVETELRLRVVSLPTS